MEEFVKRMIEEHSQLFVRIARLDDYVYSEKSDNDDKVEFANKAIQLAAMKKYEEALRARLENQGIIFDNGEYFNKVANIVTAAIPLNDQNDNPQSQDNGRKEE